MRVLPGFLPISTDRADPRNRTRDREGVIFHGIREDFSVFLKTRKRWKLQDTPDSWSLLANVIDLPLVPRTAVEVPWLLRAPQHPSTRSRNRFLLRARAPISSRSESEPAASPRNPTSRTYFSPSRASTNWAVSPEFVFHPAEDASASFGLKGEMNIHVFQTYTRIVPRRDLRKPRSGR